MQITRAFIDSGLRPEFRRPLGDDSLPKRKHYEYKGEPWDAELNGKPVKLNGESVKIDLFLS